MQREIWAWMLLVCAVFAVCMSHMVSPSEMCTSCDTTTTVTIFSVLSWTYLCSYILEEWTAQIRNCTACPAIGWCSPRAKRCALSQDVSWWVVTSGSSHSQDLPTPAGYRQLSWLARHSNPQCHARHPNVQLAHPTAPHLHPGGNGFGGHQSRDAHKKYRHGRSKKCRSMGDWKPLKKPRDASNIIQHCQSPENSFKKTHGRLQDSPRQAHLHTPAAVQGLDWLTKPVTSGTDGKLRPPWKSLFYGCACGDPSRNWQLKKIMSGHVGGSTDHCAGSSDKFWPRLKDNPRSVGRVILTSQWPSKPSLAPSSNPMDFNSATTCIAIAFKAASWVIQKSCLHITL